MVQILPPHRSSDPSRWGPDGDAEPTDHAAPDRSERLEVAGRHRSCTLPDEAREALSASLRAASGPAGRSRLVLSAVQELYDATTAMAHRRPTGEGVTLAELTGLRHVLLQAERYVDRLADDAADQAPSTRPVD